MKLNTALSPVALFFLFLSAQVAAQQNNTAAIARLEKDVPQLMKQSDVPGMTVALIRNGKLAWLHNYGVANVDTKEPVTGETIFEAASLSKVVTAYAALKLVDQGKLNLDTPLNKYLGNNYDVPTDNRINLITARRVLTHSAGFPNWRPDGSATLPVNFNPGEKFSYSGEGFVYLSKVMEKLTGMAFGEIIQKTVLEPLHMNSSSFVWQDKYKKLQVYRHDWLGNKSFRPEGPGANAAASLHTTSADYARFVIALLNGEGLTKKSWNEMLTPQINVNEKFPGLAWGLGVGLETTKDGKYFWHWGDQGDSKCYVTAQVGAKNALLFFTNSRNGLSFVRELLADALGGTHPAPDWLNYAPYNPAAKAFYQSIIDKGAVAALNSYREQRKQNGYSLTEDQINELGYGLLRKNKVADAIEVFKLNTEDFPRSSNPWDSLAEAYMVNGNKELAIKYYEKSLELDPGNTNAVEQLKKLRSPGN